MSGHRWIRRRDKTVWLFVSGVHCGTLMKRLGGRWSAHYATGEDIGQKDGPSTKAAAKRALLRAVMAPKTKSDAKVAKAGEWRPLHNGPSGAGGCFDFWVGAKNLGFVQPANVERQSYYASIYDGPRAWFVTEAEARWWVEWRSKVER